MLLSPLQNTAQFNLDWIQKRPRVTQKFGKDFRLSNGKLAYASMGMKGHNGIDFGVPLGTPVFAPCDGYVQYFNHKKGYGKHVKIRSSETKREVVLGHMSFLFDDKYFVRMGDIIGLSGNTGFSTAPHLHFGMRNLIASDKNLWNWLVQDYDNGYFGYIDILPYLITWKGGFLQNNMN